MTEACSWISLMSFSRIVDPSDSTTLSHRHSEALRLRSGYTSPRNLVFVRESKTRSLALLGMTTIGDSRIATGLAAHRIFVLPALRLPQDGLRPASFPLRSQPARD